MSEKIKKEVVEEVAVEVAVEAEKHDNLYATFDEGHLDA